MWVQEPNVLLTPELSISAALGLEALPLATWMAVGHGFLASVTPFPYL